MTRASSPRTLISRWFLISTTRIPSILELANLGLDPAADTAGGGSWVVWSSGFEGVEGWGRETEALGADAGIEDPAAEAGDEGEEEDDDED